MIKIQELRVGNYLYYKVFPHAPESYKIIEVISISKNGFISFINDYGNEETHYLDNFEKIPLTEEILFKFLFNNDGHGRLLKNQYNRRDKCISSFIFDFSNYYITWQNNFGELKIKFIDYIHNFQNIYFALTNDELTFKKD